MIHKDEITALRSSLNAFIKVWNEANRTTTHDMHIMVWQSYKNIDDQFVNAMQASHRILQIIDPIKEPLSLDKNAQVMTATKATGDSCPRCFGMRILRKGGCTTCEDCKFFLGCGQ